VMAAARGMAVDPHLGAAIARLKAHGWDIVVASAGCDWYITRLLDAAGVSATLYANPGTYDPADGLRMRLPVESPVFSPDTGIDKVAVVRAALTAHACVAFAGDGRPDLPAAMLVPPERRFARGWLADALTTDGIPYHPFENWKQIADILLNGGRG